MGESRTSYVRVLKDMNSYVKGAKWRCGHYGAEIGELKSIYEYRANQI